MFKDAGFDSSDIFSRIFGSGFQHRGGGFNRQRKGEDYDMEMKITFQEAFAGGEKRVAFSKGGVREELSVKIPPGIDNGARLRLAGKGGPGSGNGPAGDIYLNIAVQPDPVFTREGHDIVVERHIRFTEAVLGASLDVPTMDGPKRLKVPAGIQPGTKIRLKGFGFPYVGKTSKGDLYVRIEVKVPEHLTPRQKELAQELADEGL
jgi:curved DNA-binding protein